VSDTSTDNVPEGSQSATLKALIEEMRAATSGDINAAIPKSLAKRALDAGLIKKEDMGMALIARVAMKDAVDAYDAQPAPEGSKPATLGLFENMGENGALMEYPEVAASLNKYVQDIDFAALDVATKSEEYAQYKATMASNLAAAYPSGEIPVTRTEGYADPKAEKTKRNFTVRPEDVAFVGNVDEQELVIRTPEGKLQSVRIGTAAPIEEVAVDLKVAAEREAAKLQGAQLPSIDEEVLDTVEGLGGARAAADARTKGYEQNINRIVAVSEEARAKQRAADEAQAAQIAAERTQQYGKGDLRNTIL
jgi:hypothetical protein